MRRHPYTFAIALTAALSCAAVAGSGAAGTPRTVSEAFVTNQTGDSLSVVSLPDMRSVAEITIGGKPAGIAMSPDGKHAYITAPEGKEVVVIDTLARQVTKRIKVGQGPLGIAAHPTQRTHLRRRLVHAQNLGGRSAGGRRS